LGPLGETPADAEPLVFLRPKRLRNARFSEPPMRNAAVCNAVAAAALLARWARAACNFDAHSGRILSVRMTLGLLADTDWLRRRPAPLIGDPPAGDRVAEFTELLEDIAALGVPRAVGDMLYAKPRRKGGGS